ncbi:MAG: Putative oxidoreductase YncB, partial [uncultured Frankineae bacterium]
GGHRERSAHDAGRRARAATVDGGAGARALRRRGAAPARTEPGPAAGAQRLHERRPLDAGAAGGDREALHHQLPGRRAARRLGGGARRAQRLPRRRGRSRRAPPPGLAGARGGRRRRGHRRRRHAGPDVAVAGGARSDRLHGVRRTGAGGRAAPGRPGARLGGRRSRGVGRGPARAAARCGPGRGQRGWCGQGGPADRRARLRRRDRPPRGAAGPGTGPHRARGHRPLLRQRRRGPPGRRPRRPAAPGAGGAVRDDLAVRLRGPAPERRPPDPGRAQADHPARLHRAGPRGPAPRVRAAGRGLAAQRRAGQPVDGRRRDRPRRRGLPRHAAGRQRRQDARAPGRVRRAL